MTTLEAGATTIRRPEPDLPFDEARLAAAAFLARYGGRTLDAYRHDLRVFFQWAADNRLIVLQATRPHIELYRGAMEQRGLAASTIDRRLSTVCGFYRSLTSMDALRRPRPSTSVAPRCSRVRGAGWAAPSSVRSCSLPSASTATTPPSQSFSG